MFTLEAPTMLSTVFPLPLEAHLVLGTVSKTKLPQYRVLCSLEAPTALSIDSIKKFP